MVWRRTPKTTTRQRRGKRDELRVDFDDLAAAEPAFDPEVLQAALDAEAEARSEIEARRGTDTSAA